MLGPTQGRARWTSVASEDALDQQFPGKFPHVFSACELCHAPFLHDLEREGCVGHGAVWHMWMLAVHPGAGGRGVGTRLVEHNLALAAACGYPMAMAECTNVYSTRCFERHGFQLRHRLVYADFEFPEGSGKHPMHDKVEPGFDAAECMVRRV